MASVAASAAAVVIADSERFCSGNDNEDIFSVPVNYDHTMNPKIISTRGGSCYFTLSQVYLDHSPLVSP